MPHDNIIAYQALDVIFGAHQVRVYRPVDINDQDTARIFLNRDDVFSALSTTETFDALDSVEDVELITNINESGAFEKTSAVCLRDLYQQAIVHKKNNQLFVNFFEYLKFDKSELFSNFIRDYCENPDVEFFGCNLPPWLKEMTQEQRESFVRVFNTANPDKPMFNWSHIKDFYAAKEKPPATSVYLINGVPVIKAITLSRLLGWDHSSIIEEIKRSGIGHDCVHFFETDDSLWLDYEVTESGYLMLVEAFGISNQEQANNDDAICAEFARFENIGKTEVPQPPKEIALAVEMIEELGHKHIGHLTVNAAINEYQQDPIKYQHHQRLLNLFHLSFLDGCVFIADRCPLVDYELLHWHPDSITDIPHDFGTVRLSIMIRLFDSKIDSDIAD